MKGQVLLLCAILGLVTAQSSETPAFSTVTSTPGCWYEGLCKNRGDAGEDMIRDIPVTEDTLETMMEWCYLQCQGEPTCAHFTAVAERGGNKCFLLTEQDTCDLDTNAECFTTYGTCNSGPKDCSNNFNCPMLDIPAPGSDTIEWNCHKDGVDVDPYTQQSPEGTTCSLNCPAWINDKGELSDIESICVQGVWQPSRFIPSGRDSALNETIGDRDLPQPDGPDQISCGCPVYDMAWTTAENDTVDYDPNTLPGTSFVCDGPYITDDGTDFKFKLMGDVTCKMYCDSYHIATMTCAASGEWTGQPELGAWCYAEPQVSDDMGPGTTTTGAPVPSSTQAPP